MAFGPLDIPMREELVDDDAAADGALLSAAEAVQLHKIRMHMVLVRTERRTRDPNPAGSSGESSGCRTDAILGARCSCYGTTPMMPWLIDGLLGRETMRVK